MKRLTFRAHPQVLRASPLARAFDERPLLCTALAFAIGALAGTAIARLSR